MFRYRVLLFLGPLLAVGCTYATRERTDEALAGLTAHPFDLAPASQQEPVAAPAKPESQNETKAAPQPISSPVPAVPTDVQTTAFLQPAPRPDQPEVKDLRSKITIPSAIPGAETPDISKPEGWPKTDPEKVKAAKALYPPLPALPVEPKPLPGPDGKAYTLSQLQHIAAENSPTLRQAAFDVDAARGNVIQAAAYPNPTISLQSQPSNDGSTAGLWGVGIDQTIRTGGKLRLATAAAEKALDNAELALKRARSDLATQVRNAYFGLLVAKETVRVNKALAEFTDEVYRLQEKLLEVGSASPYEPGTLRAQAYAARLAYQQSIQTYTYAWKQLVASVGLRQLPLSDVAGRIDANIPYYEYDRVLAHVLRNHTDVLTAANGLDAARYNLKLAQVVPVSPDLDVNVAILKEFALAPEKWVPTVSIGVPLPLWDQNKGNIIAADAALGRAVEEPHRVELALTTNLATNYTNYRTNLEALDYYRKFILPDLVRTYRGVFVRYYVSGTVAFVDMVTAQQALAAGVTQYLTILGQLWTSVTSVADMMQTDDLFQLAQPREVPPLPSLESLPPLPCCHPGSEASACVRTAVPTDLRPMTPAPEQAKKLAPQPATTLPAVTTPAKPMTFDSVPAFVPAESVPLPPISKGDGKP